MGARDAADALRARLGAFRPRVAIVAGSGLGGLGMSVEDAITVPYRDIPGLPEPHVEGHGGELIAGFVRGTPVIVQSGRLHLYEGHSPETVSLAVRAFGCLGVRTIVLTNAAGGINRLLPIPGLMLIADHLNLTWRNPLIGPVQEGEERFPDMSAPYDAGWRAVCRKCAVHAGIPLAEGVYAGVLGPTYETPAEIRMLERCGADAVGMSTVPEVLAARARGMRVLGLCTITNPAAGRSPVPLSHQEVLAVGERMVAQLERLVTDLVAEVGASGRG